jgi:23S rRNA (uracil1939-C5)-methyltransferase
VIERIGEWKLRFPVGVFSQANPPTARKLYDQVRSLAALKGGEIALDVYCGVGPIALNLAAAAELVWGVDDSALAIATAKQNARMNGVRTAASSRPTRRRRSPRPSGRFARVDVAVVNPPRKGTSARCDGGAARFASAAYHLCLVQPETLARDLDKLVASGYRAPRSILRHVPADRPGREPSGSLIR